MRRLASTASCWAHSRTWVTEPGEDATRSSAIVWMLSTSTSSGRDLVDRRDDAAHRRLGGDPHVVDGGGEAQGAALHLLLALLGADVEHRRRPPGGELHRQRALADARLAAEQRDRPGDQPAAEHPVELGDAGRPRRAERSVDVGETADRSEGAQRAAGITRIGRRDGLLDDRVPRPAPRALPRPLGVRGAALDARQHCPRRPDRSHGGILTQGCHTVGRRVTGGHQPDRTVLLVPSGCMCSGAERVGFEPTGHLKAATSLAGRRVRPDSATSPDGVAMVSPGRDASHGRR